PPRLEVREGGATKVVGDSSRESRPPARPQPGPPERLDWPAGAVEQPGDDRPRRFLARQRALALALQHGPQGGRERKLPPLRVLGLTRLQPQPAAVEVDVRPLPRQNLRLPAPAGNVGDGECS